MSRCHRGTIPINVERALWRSSGGYCANPACRAELLLPLVDKLINIGEMAHVIASSPNGPRGSVKPGERETFENLVLLCGTCHSIVDAAPEQFPVQLLARWKRDRERAVLDSAGLPRFTDRADLDQEVSGLLRENSAVHEIYGPDAHADGHPLADAKSGWERELGRVILPNNHRVVALCRANEALMTQDERRAVERFALHAEGLLFNHTSGDKDPSAPRFPAGFPELFSDA